MNSPRNDAAVEEQIRAELASLKQNVPGVLGCVVATSDGFLVAHDVPDMEPSQVAALAATTHALAFRATLATGRGQFRESVTRGSHGYFAVFALGDSAIIAVTGTPRLNVGMLQYQARDVIERLGQHTAEFRRSAAAAAPDAAATPGAPGAPAAPGEQPAAGEPGGSRALPRRRTPRSLSAELSESVKDPVQHVGSWRAPRS